MSALLLYCALLSMPPPVALSDLSWLPPADATDRALEWNRTVYRSVSERIDLHTREDFLDTVQARWLAWNLLDDAWRARDSMSWSETPELDRDRAEACLLRLRGLIGLQAYYAGRLPEPVPVELFEGDGQ